MTSYPPGTGCLCWSARNCLMLWTGLSIALTSLGVILSFATGEWTFSNSNEVVSFITAIGVCLFVFLAAALKRKILLKVGFFLIIMNILALIVGCILSILIVTGSIGNLYFTNKGGAIAFLVIFYIVAIFVQCLLAWTIRRTIKEINLDVYNLPSHNPCHGVFGTDEIHMAVENTRWHQDCFRCAQCFCPLNGEIYYFFEGRLYCKHDFEILYSPVCTACSQYVVGVVKKALNKSYHSHCFNCSDCGSSLEDGVWNNDGRPTCKQCYDKIPKKAYYICTQCKRPIDDEDLLRRGHDFFHACHFDCSECKTTLTKTARELRGKLYCPRCYDTKCDVCAGCRKVIDPQEERSIFVLDKHYHVEHFRCYDCGKQFLGQEHFEKNKNAFCKDCFVERYGDYCFLCQTGLTGTSVRLFGKGWCAGCYSCWICYTKLSHKDKVLDYDLKPVCKKCSKNKNFQKSLENK